MFFIKFQAKHILYIVIYIAICLKLKEMFNKLRHVFSFEFWAKYIYCDLYIFNKLWCKITLDGSWSNLPLLLVKSHLLSGLEVFVFFCPVYLIMASFTTVYFLLPCLLWPCSTLTAVCFCVLPPASCWPRLLPDGSAQSWNQQQHQSQQQQQHSRLGAAQ